MGEVYAPRFETRRHAVRLDGSKTEVVGTVSPDPDHDLLGHDAAGLAGGGNPRQAQK
jgi:hypothetical protein